MHRKLKISLLFLGFGVFDPKLSEDVTLKTETFEVKKSDITNNPYWVDLQENLKKESTRFEKSHLRTQEFLFLWNESRKKLFSKFVFSESEKTGERTQDYIQKNIYQNINIKKMTEKDMVKIHDDFLDKHFNDLSIRRSFKKPKDFESSEFSNAFVFFGDLFCEDCRRWIQTLKKIKEQRGDIKALFRPFFFETDQWSQLAYEGAYCIDSVKAGAFWDYLYFFINKIDKEKIEENIMKIVDQTGVDRESFKQCFLSRKFKSEVTKQLEYAKSLGLKAPPAVIADGFAFVSHPGDRLINEVISDVEFYSNTDTKVKSETLWQKFSYWLSYLLRMFVHENKH